MPDKDLRLLCLDGGGVRGLSSLIVLQYLMETINPDNPPKPCEYFDMIGGTSTGGLIAVMLGRLQMSIQECTAAYVSLSSEVFRKSRQPFTLFGKVQGRFDDEALENAVKKILVQRGLPPDELLKDAPDSKCKVFVCVTSEHTSQTACLTSYRRPSRGSDLLATTKIWEACRATSAASSFFNPITIGPYKERFIDGATGANNPVRVLWNEAQALWGSESNPLDHDIRCLVSIGTGKPSLEPFGRSLTKIAQTLCKMATETEKTARDFREEKESMHKSGRYFRLNVLQGLEKIGLEEADKIDHIVAATRNYVESPDVSLQLQQCRDGPIKGPSLPSYRHNLESANTRFIGRDNELQAMDRSFFVEQECSKLAIVGLGGVGKTQLALKFAHGMSKTRPEYSIFWLPAFSMQSYEKTCADLVEELGISDTGNSKGDEKNAKMLFKQHLDSGKAGKWILILDNADDEEVLFGPRGDTTKGIARYLPDSEEGLTIVTTRFRGIAVDLAESNMIELKGMSPEEAQAFLARSLTHKNQEGTETLLQELTYLPLAIAQAAAFMNKKQTPVTRYLELLHKPEQEVVGLLTKAFRVGKGNNSEVAVATTWLVSFDQIRRDNQKAAELLKFIGCLEHKAIPQSIFPEINLEADMEDAIGTLCSYDFLTRLKDGVTFNMHRLVHLAIRAWLSHDDLAKEEANATRRLFNIFPTPDNLNPNRRLSSSYLPHALRLLKATRENKMLERYVLCLKVGGYLFFDGRTREGIEWMQEVYQVKEQAPTQAGKFLFTRFLALLHQSNGQMHKSIELLQGAMEPVGVTSSNDQSPMDSQIQLAITYRSNNQAQKAVEIMEQLFARNSNLPPDNSSLLNLRQQLAFSYKANNQGQKAIEQLQAVVKIRKSLPSHNELLLGAQQELAVAYRDLGKYQESIDLLLHILKMKERLPTSHPSRLSTQHELGRSYRENGQPQKSIDELKHVVEYREEALPETHLDLLASQHALALAYKQIGQHGQSAKLFEHVVQIREKALPENDPTCLSAKHELAEAYCEVERSSEATRILQDVVTARAKALPESDSTLVTSRYALAKALIANGQHQEAITALEEILEFRQKMLGKNHPDNLAARHKLAEVYSLVGKTQEAVEILESVVTALKKQPEGPKTSLPSQHALAEAYRKNKQSEEAVKLLKHVLDARRQFLAQDHRHCLEVRQLLRDIYWETGQTQEAVDLLRDTVMILKKARPEDDPDYLASEHSLAVGYEKNNEPEKAVGIWEHIIEIRQKSLSEDHDHCLESQHSLAGVFLDIDKPEQALPLMEHVFQVRKERLSEDHPLFLATEHALAKSHRYAGEAQVAVDLLEHVVRLRSSLPSDHEYRVESELDLALSYEKNGQSKEHLDILTSTTARLEKSLGNEALLLIYSRTLLALAYKKNGQEENANQMARKVVPVLSVFPEGEMFDAFVAQFSSTLFPT